MRPCAVLALVCVMPLMSWAQSDYRRHNFQVNLGAAVPNGELRDYFSNSAAVGVGYGYRFHEFFQVEGGFDTVFGAARIRDFLPSGFGDLRIRDFQHMVPFGGAVILPIADDRVQIQGGLGGAYLRYTERIRQPFTSGGLRFECPVCSSRSGWGYYGRVGVTVALDQAQNFRVGVGGRVYRGETDGDPFGGVPSRRTEDRWLHIYGSFGFSF